MTDITLEKIDLVRERTGVTYAEAKFALETHNGSVVEAIVAIESEAQTNQYTVPVNQAVAKVKELLKQGNVTRIRILHQGNVIVDVPVTVGVIAAILAPVMAAVGAVAALATKCTIEVERAAD